MADFVAVLRKTIDALGDNTPEMREKVYDKARSTIEAKLAAINPPPPQAVADRQRKALEDAIAVLRTDYADAVEAEEDDSLEDAFATLKGIGAPPPAAVKAPEPAVKIAKPAEEPAPAQAPEPVSPPAGDRPVAASSAVDPAADSFAAPDDAAAPEMPSAPEMPPATVRERDEPRGSRGRKGLIAALILLLVAAGAGYAAWMNRDGLSTLVGIDAGQEERQATAPEGVETAEELNQTPPEEPATEEEDVANLPAAEEPETPPAAAETPAPNGEAEKFTQRLMPDGSEVDEGPAGETPTVGEGTSIASVAQPDGSPSEPGQAGEGEAATPAGEEDGEQATTPSVAVGQRAIFYEERTSAAQGSAEAGSIVWSTVQESPGGDLPPEPAIRAEATIPGKDIQLRMTIRRNGDQTLPASHIIEMIFLTPEGFEGGAISNVSRIAFKETEQAPGNPLIGIPAKIADGFFLIALGDAPAEVEANTTLLRRQSWVDIPIVYQSGRRALLSLEKGIPGDRVFQEVLRAWDEASSG